MSTGTAGVVIKDCIIKGTGGGLHGIDLYSSSETFVVNSIIYDLDRSESVIPGKQRLSMCITVLINTAGGGYGGVHQNSGRYCEKLCNF